MRYVRGQSIAEADREVRQFVIRVAAVLGEVLQDSLAGIYLHGSLATGSFHRERSDIDFIAVTTRSLTQDERAALARVLVRLSDERPTVRDIELTVITQEHAQHFTHPLPYELHYSDAYHELFRRKRFDFQVQRESRDLAVQLVEARERGVALFGPPPERVFGLVPWYAYIDSLREDFMWAGERAAEMPLYAILNACRILNGVSERGMSVLNKDEAGVWALQATPEQYHPAVRDALLVYRGVKSLDDVIFSQPEIAALRAYVFDRAHSAFERATDTDDE